MKLTVPRQQVSCRATQGRSCFHSPGAGNSHYALASSVRGLLELCLLNTLDTHSCPQQRRVLRCLDKDHLLSSEE